MKVASLLYQNNTFIKEINKDELQYENVQLLLGFGSGKLITDLKVYSDIQSKFPNATLCLCSTAGEIFDVEVFDHSISLLALSFSTSYIKTAVVNIESISSSLEAGQKLIDQLPKENLRLIFDFKNKNPKK